MIEEQYSWGIIGSPNGYQYSFQGADFGLWQHWDLSGSGALALPEPSQESIKYPLYCLQGIRNKEERSHFLCLAMYCSVRQQNSHRSGTFAGSFISCKDISLNQNNNNNLINLLWQLTKHQLSKFVSADSFSYHGDISNAECFTPEIVSDLEVEKQNFSFIFPSQETQILFITINNNEELKKTLDLLLQSNITDFYEKIYFSQNTKTIENFKKDDDVDCYDYSQISGILQTIRYLSGEILHNKIAIREANQTIQKNNDDFQDRLAESIDQVEKRLTDQYLDSYNKLKNDFDQLQDQNARLKEEISTLHDSDSKLKEYEQRFHQIRELLPENSNTARDTGGICFDNVPSSSSQSNDDFIDSLKHQHNYELSKKADEIDLLRQKNTKITKSRRLFKIFTILFLGITLLLSGIMFASTVQEYFGVTKKNEEREKKSNDFLPRIQYEVNNGVVPSGITDKAEKDKQLDEQQNEQQ